MSFTETREGEIPHLRLVTSDGVIFAPVKLEVEASARGGMRVSYSRNSGGYAPQSPKPMRRDGKLVYALPGGGEICP